LGLIDFLQKFFKKKKEKKKKLNQSQEQNC